MNNGPKTIIVTGASSGIGEATARRLAKEGNNIILAARSEDTLENIADELNDTDGTAMAFPVDVTNRKRMKQMVKKAIDEFGQVDAIVNNAGIMPLSMMKNTHEDEWEQMIDVNIKGVLNGISAVMDHFRERGSGHIINMSSVAGVEVFTGSAVYSGTKHAVEAITKGLRQELSDTGVRATVIRPGATESNLTDTITDEDIRAHFDGMDMETIDADAIARSISYALRQPDDVTVAEVMVTPTSQG